MIVSNREFYLARREVELVVRGARTDHDLLAERSAADRRAELRALADRGVEVALHHSRRLHN